MKELINSKLPPKWRKSILVIFIIFSIVALLGMTVRYLQKQRLMRDIEAESNIKVEAYIVHPYTKPEKIILPANVEAWHAADIYARTDGYMAEWYTDIGAKVKTGDLLAKIYTPELDAQLRQTEALLKTAETNYDLAEITAIRWTTLLRSHSVSQQEKDEKVLNAKAQLSIVASTRANRDRLKELVGFEQVVAPFDGVISARNTDIGRLINAGANGASAPPLFSIVQADKLRAYIKVPQNYATRVHSKLKVKFYFPGRPKQMYTGELLDTASAIEILTRTLLAQFVIKNTSYDLLAGSYAEAHLFLPQLDNVVRIPVNALIFQREGLEVAKIKADNTISFQKIRVGRDFGDVVEVLKGVKPGDKLILNPPDYLLAGESVQVIAESSGQKALNKVNYATT